MAIGVSIRQQIRDAVIAALNNGADKPATAWAARIGAFAEGELPAYVVRFVDEMGEAITHTRAQRTLTIRVECHVQGAAPDDLLEPLLVYAVTTLFADAALKALIERMDEPKLGWQLEGGYEDGGMAYVDFPIVFTTRRGDPTAVS